MKMCKDILKIIHIYLKQYSIMLIILLIAFSTFAATTTNKQLNGLKNGVAFYDFQLTTGIAKELEIRKGASNDEVNQKTHELYKLKEEYQKNYKEKLSKEKLAEMKHAYAVGAYLHNFPSTALWTFYNNNEDLNVLTGNDSEKYKQYLTEEELNNVSKYKDWSRMQPGSKEYFDKQEELDKVYPPALDISNVKTLTFLKENLEASKVKLKETMFNEGTNIGYYILITLIPLLIFGVEYHTNFGKFVASLPYEKEKVYFAKVILSFLTLVVTYILTGLANIAVISNSLLGKIYNVPAVFEINNKIYILGIGIVLLGAILSSFCGSILSIGVMYIPALTLIYYPLGVWIAVGRVFFENYLPNGPFIDNIPKMPIYYYFGYAPWKSIIIYLVILTVIMLVASKVYKIHNVEREGEFFIIERLSLVGYLILLMGVFTFVLIVLVNVFTINQGVALVLTILLVPAILWKLVKIKIRI
jgi:putative membrane protein